MSMMLLLKFWREALLGVLVIAALWFGHVRYAAGDRAGRAHVQASWDAEKVVTKSAFNAQSAKAAAVEAENRQAAEEIERELRTKITTADADARDLARRLHDDQIRARRCAVSGAADTAPVADGTGRESGRDAEIERAAEDLSAACARDAARLDGWVDWWSRVGR